LKVNLPERQSADKLKIKIKEVVITNISQNLLDPLMQITHILKNMGIEITEEGVEVLQEKQLIGLQLVQ
jgi:hypothetical protein